MVVRVSGARVFLARTLVALIATVAAVYAGKPLRSQEVETKPAENFFAGTVTVCTAEKITVSRIVLGKTEKRDFKLTADTKVEGKLKTNVRVTVRYDSSEDGDIATLIVIRANDSKKK